jgi:hypothetical protein
MSVSNPHRGRLVVAHPERKSQRALQKLVGATMCPVDVVADVDSLIRAVGPDAIAVVDASLARTRPEMLATPAKAWIAVPGEGLAPAELASVMGLLEAGWQHVVAHPMPILAEELLATVQKLMRDDSFGLEKYVAWGAEVRSHQLADARDRESAVATLAQDVVAAGLPDRMGSLVSVIADELLANALFTAPIDASGVRFRRGDPRDAARPLHGQEAVSIRWATDARYLAIEVRDRWGSIDPIRVSSRLSRAGQITESETATSDGMGLPLAYACANQFVVNLCPGQLTEMIGLIDVRYKPTELGRAASFHSFFGSTAPLGVRS